MLYFSLVLAAIKSKYFYFTFKVIPRYLDDTFKSHFRFRKESVEKLTRRLINHHNFQQHQTGGREPVPILKQVCIFLWYCATTDQLRELGDRFNVSNSTAHGIVRRVFNAIIDCLLPHVIKWPSGNRLREVMEGFKLLKNFENVIGAIDGTHIPILGQGQNNDAYINRKGYSSIVLQSVCDHQLMFTDCYVGWPGSVHDARVFNNSVLAKEISEKPQLYFPFDSNMLGDGAYKLESFLLTPFKGSCLQSHQAVYNKAHASTRNVIERAFGVMKSRFFRLTEKIHLRNTKEISRLVMAICTLHNFGILEDMRYGDDTEKEFTAFDAQDPPVLVCHGSARVDAERKRDEIAYNL